MTPRGWAFIRSSRYLRNVSVIVVGWCVSVTGVLVIAPAARASVRPGAGSPETSVRELSVHAGGSTLLDWGAARNDIASYPECLGHPVAYCTVTRGTGKRVLLMGDSLARMWLPAFIAIAHREALTLTVAIHPACPWPDNLGGLSISPDCQVRRADWYARVLPDVDPDIVFLANRPYDAPGNNLKLEVSGRLVSTADPIAIHAITDATTRSLNLLRRPGRELVLLEPTPVPQDRTFDPLSCLASGATNCSFTVSPLTTPLTQLDRNLATTPDVWSLNLDRLACPRFPICDPIVNDIIVRRDHSHLTATYARAQTAALLTILLNEHILTPPATTTTTTTVTTSTTTKA
jgi:hypothetical protein